MKMFLMKFAVRTVQQTNRLAQEVGDQAPDNYL
jgi:hypothetical protein